MYKHKLTELIFSNNAWKPYIFAELTMYIYVCVYEVCLCVYV